MAVKGKLRWWGAAAAIGVMLLVTPDGAAAAPRVPAAPVPGGFGSWAELFVVQEKLNTAAQRFTALPDDGYAGVVAAPEQRELRVYWKGAVPSHVRALAAQLDRDVPVRILPAQFSAREMTAEATRLANADLTGGIGPMADGSGLAALAPRGAADARFAGSLRTARMPVSVSWGVEQSRFSRAADAPLYSGGAQFYTPSAGLCTTGFTVTYRFVKAMLGAGHCGNKLEIARTPQNLELGPIVADNDLRDTMVIDARNSAGSVYVGAPQSNTKVGVGGAAPLFVGNIVCSSGGFTGEHCGIQITNVNLIYPGGAGPFAYGRQINGLCGAGAGDSGGPAYSYRADGRVTAQGIVLGGAAETVACPGGVNNLGTVGVFFADVTQTMSHFGASIVTG